MFGCVPEYFFNKEKKGKKKTNKNDEDVINDE